MLKIIELSRSGTSKYIVNKNIFLSEDDLSFYLLGAYMTDGNICDTKHRISFSLSSKDKEWIEAVRNFIAPNKPIYSSKSSECYIFDTSNIEGMNWLISFGCSPRKSKTLEIVGDIPEKYHPDFIRGVIDGDGSISTCKYKKKLKNDKENWYDKTTVYICSASRIFLEQIQKMIPENINCNICKVTQKDSFIRGRKVSATCDQYRLAFNDSNAKKLLAWTYYTDNKLSMIRKQEKAESIATKNNCLKNDSNV